MMKKKLQSGSIALITLLIVMTVTLSIGLSIYMAALSNLTQDFGDQQSQQAFALAESCLEELALQLKNNPNYTATTITLPTGSCTVTISSIGATRIMTIEAARNHYYRTLEVSVDILDYYQLHQNSWQEKKN